MKLDPALQARLQFLCRVVQKEARYLQETDARLFTDLFTPQTIAVLVAVANTFILCARKRMGL